MYPHTRRFSFVLIAALLLLAACQPATPKTQAPPTQPAVTSQPPTQVAPAVTDTAAAYPTPGEAETPAYPSVTEQPGTPAPGEAYPYPAGVPAAQNQARVTAKLIEKAPGENEGETRLHVQVLAAEDMNGLPNQAAKLVNNEADLFAQTADLPDLQPGDTFTAVVSYQGDETAGRYTAQQVQKSQ